MAWVEPNSVVYALKGVPMDRGFQHTVYWDTLSAQQTYFASKIQRTYSTNTYQRADKGRIRVKDTYANVLPCNYLMFKNTSHENKWFYAFIDSIEYINENTVEIVYTIDPLQTWHFEYELMPCFVEREHFETDNIGDSLIDEALDYGEYICYNKEEISFYPDAIEGAPPTVVSKDRMTVVIYYLIPNYSTGGNTSNNARLYWDSGTQTYNIKTVSDGDYGAKIYNIIGQQPIAFQIEAFDYDCTVSAEIYDMQRRLWEASYALNGANGSVLGIYILPADMFYFMVNQPNTSFPRALQRAYDEPVAFNYLVPKEDEHGQTETYYVPKNNKLFQYPYQVITVSDGEGNSSEYRWEYWEKENNANNTSKRANFRLITNLVPLPVIGVFPEDYNGIAMDYENELCKTNFPQVAWNEDGYLRWWAINKNSYTNNMTNAVLKATVSAVSLFASTLTTSMAYGAVNTGKASMFSTNVNGANVSFDSSSVFEKGQDRMAESTQGLVSSMKNINALVAQKKDAQALPNRLGGQLLNDGLQLGQYQIRPYVYEYTITGEYAKIVDRYLSLYGYARHEVKIPNRNVRTNWCYTKTVNCIVDGDMPMGANEEIEALFDKGITFWKDPAHLGHYEYYDWNNGVITP